MKVSLRRTHAAVLSAIALLAVVPMPGWAQSVPSPTATAASAIDPPGRVARLNYFDGSVTMEPAGATDWAYAELNRPLTTGDQLWADSGAKGELHVGSTALRLSQQTAMSIVDIDDKNLQLKVTQGTLSTRVRALPPGQTVEIDTPNVAMQASSPGEFRVDVAPDGNSTTVTLRSGTANLYGDGGVFQMTAGQQITFIGVNLQQQSGGPAPALDGFDQWVISRDRLEDGSASARYVSREIPGYEDLDANGTWRSDPNYGEVWVPTVAVTAQWAPYHQGHWTWIAPWGWTWIDDAPWGFAPFHYGRWAVLGGGWVWVPGTMVACPVYAPALVAFVGGSRFSVAVGIGGGGGVAWIPLGPREVYRPGYRVSDAYVRRVNVTHVTNINVTNVTYVNQTHVTVVPQAAFTGARPVAAAAVRVSPQAMSQAQAVNAMDVRPARESYMGRPAQPGVRFGAPPAQVAARQVVVKQAPPAAARPMGGVRVAQPVRSNGVQNNGPNNVPNNVPNRTPPAMAPRNDRPQQQPERQQPQQRQPERQQPQPQVQQPPQRQPERQTPQPQPQQQPPQRQPERPTPQPQRQVQPPPQRQPEQRQPERQQKNDERRKNDRSEEHTSE